MYMMRRISHSDFCQGIEVSWSCGRFQDRPLHFPDCQSQEGDSTDGGREWTFDHAFDWRSAEGC